MDDLTAPIAAVISDDGYTPGQKELYVVVMICLILPTLTVGLRLLIRALMKVELCYDDFCIFIALVRPFRHGYVSLMLLTSPPVPTHVANITALLGMRTMHVCRLCV